MSNPGPSHFEAVDRIFGYLLKYPDLGPCYTPYLKNRKMVGRLYGYSDASWASGREDRRSQSGWVWMLNGGPVSYKSKTQSCIAQSSSESEFIATAKCCSQGVAHRYFLVDLAHLKHQSYTGVAVSLSHCELPSSPHTSVHGVVY
mmetsp:Transcript_28321/g.44171  ORF Transcript_28321/g.44171 Transcript_28321/m.44171 type:complete len:145 (-) Transcript_28321:845-1279(-)